jgi:hypothetical protein
MIITGDVLIASNQAYCFSVYLRELKNLKDDNIRNY